ncbi:hypothetical protein [Ornithinimicrobium kibberense]|uniref:hypothetical protein n=1 Tax=Ornithinimicrobium kibberense TaxID=282060 RepID=UPI00361624A6
MPVPPVPDAPSGASADGVPQPATTRATAAARAVPEVRMVWLLIVTEIGYH